MSYKTQTTNHDTLYNLYGLRVTDQPIYDRKSETVNDLVEYFSKYLSERRFPSGFDAKLQQAIADYPDLPEFRNFRIAYLGELRLIDEAMQASRDLIRLFPDYLFARTGLAQILIRRNELAEAEILLGSPINIETLQGKQEVYHETAVHSYYSAATLLALALDDIDAASEYLPILILTLPEHPLTRHLATQLRKQQEALRKRIRKHDETYERSVESFPTVDYETTEEPPTLHHAELEVFYNTAPEEIDAETIAAIRALPRATLRADLEAILKDSIQRFEYFTEADLEEHECSAILHAFYWLGELGMEESLPLVLDWLRQGDEFIDFWTYYAPIDVLIDSLYPIAKNSLPDLLAYIKEPSQYDGARSLVATVVERVALLEEGRRAEAVEWFREVARHTVANIEDDDLIDTQFLMTWIVSVIGIKGTELWPEIQELYALNLIHWDVAGELKHIKKSIFDTSPVQKIIENYAMSIARSYGKTSDSEDVSKRIKSNPLFQKMDIIENYTTEVYRNSITYHNLIHSLEPSPKPILKPAPKPQYQASLNAPCPCGSGKKFKRCHGKE